MSKALKAGLRLLAVFAALQAALFPALFPEIAGAQGIVTLICSDKPGGQNQRYLVIHYDKAVVSFSDNPAAFPAQISLGQIVWQTPQAELPNGDMRFAARYTLNRATGELRSELQCLPRRMTSSDPSFCGPESVEYCRAKPW